jgi:signal-transduction protein with cAMP-binding, CBS, and nucleotidyltransferase domain
MTHWPAAGLGASLDTLPLDRTTVVSEADTLVEVAQLMSCPNVSCVLIREPPLRIVTEYDLVRAWAIGCSADDEVAKIATSHPYWIPVSTTPAAAAAAMINLGIQHLVVLDVSNVPLGVISMPTLFSALVQGQEPALLYTSLATVLVRLEELSASGESRPGMPSSHEQSWLED